MSKDLAKFADGEVYLWVEQESSVMLKAVSSFGDPVELTKEQALHVGHALIAAAEALD